MADIKKLEEKIERIKGIAPHFAQDRELKDYSTYFETVFGKPLFQHIMDYGYEKGSFLWVDACCGYGLALRFMKGYHPRFNMDLIGVDCMGSTNPKLEDNIKKYGEGNYLWIREDMASVDFGRKVDLISCIGGINYITGKRGFAKKKLEVIKHLFRQLDSKGILFFSDHGSYKPDIFMKSLEGINECRIFTKSKFFNGKIVLNTVVGLVKT